MRVTIPSEGFADSKKRYSKYLIEHINDKLLIGVFNNGLETRNISRGTQFNGKEIYVITIIIKSFNSFGWTIEWGLNFYEKITVGMRFLLGS